MVKIGKIRENSLVDEIRCEPMLGKLFERRVALRLASFDSRHTRLAKFLLPQIHHKGRLKFATLYQFIEKVFAQQSY